jgi:hypothetical protein
MKSSFATIASNVWIATLSLCTGIAFVASGARPEATILGSAGMLLFAIGGSWGHRQSSIRRNVPHTPMPSLADFAHINRREWLGTLIFCGLGMVLLIGGMLLAPTSRA